MDKYILVTGATSGIGQSIAVEFEKNGFTIICVSRGKPKQSWLWIQADLSVTNDFKKVSNFLAEKKITLSVLVNNVGQGHYDEWENSLKEDIERLFRVNFLSTVHLTREVIPYLKKTKGSIVNISSVAAFLPVACMGPYCATKYAMNAFSYSLKIELSRFDINVLNVQVGRINTGFADRALGKHLVPSTYSKANVNKLSAKIFRAYQKKKKTLTYPFWYYFIYWIYVLFPKLYQWCNLRAWKLQNNK